MEYLSISTSINLLIILTPLLFIKTTHAVFHFEVINSELGNPVNIGQQKMYVAKGDNLKILCIYFPSEENTTKLNSSEIFWQWNGRRFENHNKSISQYLSILHIEKVRWTEMQTFFCIYQGYTKTKEEVIKNKSLIIISGDKPKYVPEPTVEWIEGEVDINWKPDGNSTKTNYTVEYYIDAAKKNENTKTILPGVCGLFPLNNCSHKTAFYCRASFPARLVTSYVIKLVAENRFGKMASKNIRVTIPLSQQKMMLKPVKNLRVFLTNFGVRMEWTNALYYVERKKIWYKCQGSPIIHTNFTNGNYQYYEILKNRLPIYNYCMFCVSRQRYRGKFSCDTCKVIQTAEGIPKAIPKLRECKHNSCPFVRFGNFRNVTISWRLPPKRSWNGIITRQMLFYYEENERILKNITINDFNLTEWSLDKLTSSGGYHVFMVICTNAGCGRKSNIIYIPGLMASPVSFEFQILPDKANTGLLVGLTLGVLLFLFTGIFVFLYFKRHAGVMLPTVQEPQQITTEEEPNQSSPLNEAEYDVLE